MLSPFFIRIAEKDVEKWKPDLLVRYKRCYLGSILNGKPSATGNTKDFGTCKSSGMTWKYLVRGNTSLNFFYNVYGLFNTKLANYET